jgi:hypothetical protein
MDKHKKINGHFLIKFHLNLTINCSYDQVTNCSNGQVHKVYMDKFKSYNQYKTRT